MEIIEQMSSERFETVCDAGVDLVKELFAVLKKFNLTPGDAMAVIGIAVAGVAKGHKIPQEDLLECLDVAGKMWREEQRPEGTGIVFDPIHRRPEYVEPARDMTSEN